MSLSCFPQGNSGGDGPAGPPGERVSIPARRLRRPAACPPGAGWGRGPAVPLLEEGVSRELELGLMASLGVTPLLGGSGHPVHVALVLGTWRWLGP